MIVGMCGIIKIANKDNKDNKDIKDNDRPNWDSLVKTIEIVGKIKANWDSFRENWYSKDNWDSRPIDNLDSKDICKMVRIIKIVKIIIG